MLTVVLVIVLFGVTLASDIVESRPNADVKVTAFETITVVDIFGSFEGRALDTEGVGVMAITACLLTLRRIMSF